MDSHLFVDIYYFEQGKTYQTWVFIKQLHKWIQANPNPAKLKIQPKFEEKLPPIVAIHALTFL
jgi:uncharacterized protein YqcC (DUF446 family)